MNHSFDGHNFHVLLDPSEHILMVHHAEAVATIEPSDNGFYYWQLIGVGHSGSKEAGTEIRTAVNTACAGILKWLEHTKNRRRTLRNLRAEMREFVNPENEADGS